jgi:hypothetical protein
LTYKYGSRLGNSIKQSGDTIPQGELTKLWNERRTNGVYRAEVKEANKNKLPIPSLDSAFSSTNSVKDLSTEFPNQGISSLVISTPRGGPHMVDSLDGSFRVL